MIALKNTTNNQIFYIIHKRMYGKSDGYGLTTLDVEYTENGQYSINPPSGYDGLSKVNVTVDVENGDCNLTTSTVTITGDGEHTITPPDGYDGFSEVVVNVESDCDDAYNEGVADQKAKLASATFTENGSYNREDGWNTVQVNVDTVTPYNEGVEDGKDAQKALMTSLTAVSNGTYTRDDGYNEVVVNVPSDVRNQNKQVEFTQNGTQTVLADSGYSGLGQVEVSVNVDTTTPYNEGKQDGIDEQKSKLTELQVTQNGEYTREDGYNRVVVDVDLDGPYNEGREDGIEEQKAKLTDITIVSNGHYSREDGYDDITVNVPSDINNQNKQVTYTQNGTQTIVADNGYSGLGQVAVTVNVDTVTPYNNGFNDGVADQKSKLITETFTRNGTYTRADGYNEVVINIPSDVNNQNKTVNPSTSNQVITANQGYSGLGQVTVNAVTASIDPDIKPENILEGVDILGVIGTNKGYDNGYAEGESDQKAKLGQLNVTSNGTYSAEDGYGTVIVNVPSDYNEGYADGKQDGIDEQKAKLASLTITQNGTYTREDGYNEIIVNVQCGDLNELQLSRETIDMKYSDDFPTDGVEYPIGVYSTDDWTITSKPDWVSTDSNSGNAGTSVLMVTVTSFEDGRTGTITITNGNLTKTITITQIDYSSRYLTLEVTSPGTLYWKQYGTAHSRDLEYSTNGEDWLTCTSLRTDNGCKVKELNTGDKLMFKSTTSYDVNSDNYHYFVFADGLRGNISGNLDSIPKHYKLFRDCTGILSAEHLIISEGSNCDGLFYGCTRLNAAPKSLPTGYYANMFFGCTSLTIAPELPSTTLSTLCYASMFNGCTSLTTVPSILPATTLAENCYANMFRGCTSLTTAPELPAETLVNSCYNYMFLGCTSLNYVKAMFTTTPGDNYTSLWMYNTSSTGIFVKNSAATWNVTGDNGIPTGWTVETA